MSIEENDIPNLTHVSSQNPVALAQATPNTTPIQPVKSAPPPIGVSLTTPVSIPVESTERAPIVGADDFRPSVVDTQRQPRTRRLPRCYRDELPESTLAAVPTPTVDQPSLPRRVILHVFDPLRTAFNTFGIARDYRHCPSYDPDSFLSVSDLSDTPRVSSREFGSAGPESCEDLYGPSGDRAPPWPWANMSIWRLMSWKLTGSNQKSNDELTRLVKEVIQAPDFKVADLAKFSALTELRRLDNEDTGVLDLAGAFSRDDWKQATPEISIPI